VLERRRVRVRGTVQGVGFRPFVYRLATARGLSGWVRNDGEGVLAEVQGDASSVAALLAALRDEAPPLSLVEAVEHEPVAVAPGRGFTIGTSATGPADVPVSADVAPCERCLAELLDRGDRRFRYPFLNCTDCGPRYTIVRGVPYDRPATTMSSFRMCAACRREYDDPSDRRFHAQPIACPECGPQLSWAGERAADGPDALAAAVTCLRGGGVVAVKAVGGYHLACDAGDEAAVRRRDVPARRRREAGADVAAAAGRRRAGAARRTGGRRGRARPRRARRHAALEPPARAPPR
jgi:hydrogenase maturation protein HypF